MEESIDLRELFQILRNRLSLILIITITAVFVSGLFTFFYLTPMYQSSTKLLINQAKDSQTTVNPSDIQVQADIRLIDTYNQIIKSSRILAEVAEKLGTDVTVDQLNKQIEVQKTENSQVVTILVKDASAKHAAKIANTTAEVFQTEIVKIMKVDNVNILDKAVVNNLPVEPNPTLNIAIALVVGLMAGIGVAFLLEYFDNTLKSEQDIEVKLGAPVLGCIATIGDVKVDKSREQRRAIRKSAVKGERFDS